MNLYNYLNNLQVPFEYKNTIAKILLNHHDNMTFGTYCTLTKKKILPDDFSLPENYLDLMEIVNRMVKDKFCPNNYKNRFYSYKKKIINACAEEGRISDVYDEGDYLSLVIDGKYSFHQIKKQCSIKYTPMGKREYKNINIFLPFNENVFKLFQLAAVFYLGKQRFLKNTCSNVE